METEPFAARDKPRYSQASSLPDCIQNLDSPGVFIRLIARPVGVGLQTARRARCGARRARGRVKRLSPRVLEANIRLMFYALVTRLRSPRALLRPRMEN